MGRSRLWVRHVRFVMLASWLLSLADALQRLEESRCYYNEKRPHSELGKLTPAALPTTLNQPEDFRRPRTRVRGRTKEICRRAAKR